MTRLFSSLFLFSSEAMAQNGLSLSFTDLTSFSLCFLLLREVFYRIEKEMWRFRVEKKERENEENNQHRKKVENVKKGNFLLYTCSPEHHHSPTENEKKISLLVETLRSTGGRQTGPTGRQTGFVLRAHAHIEKPSGAAAAKRKGKVSAAAVTRKIGRDGLKLEFRSTHKPCLKWGNDQC